MSKKAIAAFNGRNQNNENESFIYRNIQNRASRLQLNGSDGEMKASDCRRKKERNKILKRRRKKKYAR